MIDQELLESFRDETRYLLMELTEMVTKLEEPHAQFPSELLREFAQRTDRIMGAAKTIEICEPGNPGMVSIGNLTELCKKVGNAASRKGDSGVLPLCVAFWSDTLEILQSLLDQLEHKTKCEEIARVNSKVLEGRLKWLLEKLQ